jgi:hypothetical protein
VKLCSRITMTIVGMAAILATLGCADEGQRFADKYWGDRLKNCGDTFVAYDPHSGQVTQCRNPTIWARADVLSEADKLNGFEWLGNTGFSCSSTRFRIGPKGGFTNWVPSTLREPGESRTWKKKGDWTAEEGNLAVNPDCSSVK